MKLVVLICTHNRVELLRNTITSLNQCRRPLEGAVELLVVANACTDATESYLGAYREAAPARGELPLRWLAESRPGKARALNRAIPELAGDVVAFVDDDHRVDRDYLVNVLAATHRYSGATMFCGRILPDWDGTEPAWPHDASEYRIYPLPVPRYDLEHDPRPIGEDGPIPGGGNLFLRAEVFARVGYFATYLGPRGHDLGGAEDSDFVLRALDGGETLQYVPGVVQYHFVDPERLRLSYLLRKGYQRSRASTMVRGANEVPVPMYMWRKLITYVWCAVTSLYWPEIRFYLVRVASTLGEISAHFSGRPEEA